ncbi:MAG: SPOCS domain-containing protein [Enterocloster sp.]
MELVKKQIHMNQWKGNVTTQITLDDDFIVPDTMDDMEQVMLDTGEIQMETVKNQGGKVNVKGRLEFQVLYRREQGGLQTLGGTIPFEESVNVPGLEEKDYIGVTWMLEDLNTDMIHSRKLGVQAIVTLQVRVEALRDVEAAVDVAQESEGLAAGAGEGPVQVETLKRKVNAAAIAVRRKDTYRIKEELSLTGGKPNIGRLLWREMRLRDVSAKPLDGCLRLEGELTVFVIYSPEDESMPVQWLEEAIPFSGDMEMSDVREELIPMVTVRLAHRDIEAKPDYDGEMREMDVDAVLELDIKLYDEQEVELLKDMYSNMREIELTQAEAAFDQILARNVCRAKASEKFSLPQGERVLQICHTEGTVSLDEVEIGEDSLKIEGVLEVTLLYLTSDDRSPVQSMTEQVPFRCTAEAPGIREDSVYQLDAGLEQLGAVMTGGDMVEIKAVIALDFLVLQPVREPVITGASVKPMDMQRLQELPGIVGYIVQPGDSLWSIAKRFHTTAGTIISTNELADDQVKSGQRLLLVKEIAQG